PLGAKRHSPGVRQRLLARPERECLPSLNERLPSLALDELREVSVCPPSRLTFGDVRYTRRRTLQYQCGNTGAMPERQLERRPSAHRVAKHRRLADVERAQQPNE